MRIGLGGGSWLSEPLFECPGRLVSLLILIFISFQLLFLPSHFLPPGNLVVVHFPHRNLGFSKYGIIVF